MEQKAPDDLSHQTRVMQAVTVRDRMITTLVANMVISTSAVALAVQRHSGEIGIWTWYAFALATLVLRLLLNVAVQHFELAENRPLLTLRLLAAGSLMSGLAWAFLPFSIENFDALSTDSGLYLLMLGIAAGSALLGAGYSLLSLAFSMPPHISVGISLYTQGSTSGVILAMDVIALTAILFRSSLTSEKIFLQSAEGKLQATMLAASLTAANTDIIKANTRLEHLANCDPLTALSNRTAFNAALAQGIQQAQLTDSKLALLIVDLDRFKAINDTMGHKAGDALLVQFANRLRRTLAAEDIVARLGGDEFAVIVTGPDAVARARAKAEIVLRQARNTFTPLGKTCSVGISVGLAIYPDHAREADELFINADMALYRSKERGRGRWSEFDPEFRAEAERQRHIEQDLSSALETGAIEAWFQPQIGLGERNVIGFEALVRWHHPVLGFIPPPEIVRAAQVTQQADKLTATMAHAACRLLGELPGLGLPHATVAVNVTPSEFALYSVADMLKDIAQRHSIRPSLLEIEITEETLFDTNVAGEQLKRLEQFGFKLAVDDFGAGHSSLTRLIDLKVDRLKIDRALSAGVSASRRNRDIVCALVSLGQALSMNILAEGIETEEDAEVLRTLGCDVVQGYLFARAMPSERLPGWLTEHGERAVARRSVA